MASSSKPVRRRDAQAKKYLAILVVLTDLASSCCNATASKQHHDHLSCGKSSAIASRILGGQSATFAAWPWMVSLGSYNKGNWEHRCGGSLINHEWVLTAAHCVPTYVRESMKIRLGELNFTSVDEPLAHEERSAKEFIVHPNWNDDYRESEFLENDVALVRMERPVEFGGHISPICLPVSNVGDLAGRIGTLTGWGEINNDGFEPDNLIHIKLPILTTEDCELSLREHGYPVVRPYLRVCTGPEDGGEGVCFGDSGSPLQLQDRNDSWFVAGITSHIFAGYRLYECGMPRGPSGAFTRVSEYVDWIRQHVNIVD